MSNFTDGSWDLPPRIATDIISEHLDDLLSGTSYRIGTGQTVPAPYVQVVTRALFVEALHRLTPQTMHELACNTAYEIVENGYKALGEWSTYPDDGRAYREVESRQDRYVDDWQRRHGLPDAWLHTAATMTMQRAYELDCHGQTYDGSLILPDATAFATLHDIPAHPLTDIPAHLDGDISTFNPRTETVDDAVKRLLPVLESQLRQRLNAVAKDDRTLNDALKVVRFRTTTAYEWLVRYQVRRESRAAIARADDVDRGHVTRTVNQTAAQVGLTLRESPGGRPQRSRSHTKRVR